MRRITTVAMGLVAALTLLAAAAVVGVPGPTPAAAADAERGVYGYSLHTADNGQTCSLVLIDFATGDVQDLPAPASAEACAYDLAVTPDDTARGFRKIDPTLTDEALPTTVASRYVTTTIGSLIDFAVDGTATRTDVKFPEDYLVDFTLPSMLAGLAIDADGTHFVMISGMWVDVTTCLPGVGLAAVDVEAADGLYNWSSCLFTLDPTTGDLTLVGPTRFDIDDFLGLSIGSTGAVTMAYDGGHDPLEPSAIPPTEAYWSTVDTTTGEVTKSTVGYPVSNGYYDQLRSQPTIYALARNIDNNTLSTATVDPLTGTITPMATVAAPANVMQAVLGVFLGPEPARPTFTG